MCLVYLISDGISRFRRELLRKMQLLTQHNLFPNRHQALFGLHVVYVVQIPLEPIVKIRNQEIHKTLFLHILWPLMLKFIMLVAEVALWKYVLFKSLCEIMGSLNYQFQRQWNRNEQALILESRAILG